MKDIVRFKYNFYIVVRQYILADKLGFVRLTHLILNEIYSDIGYSKKLFVLLWIALRNFIIS